MGFQFNLKGRDISVSDMSKPNVRSLTYLARTEITIERQKTAPTPWLFCLGYCVVSKKAEMVLNLYR